MYHPREYRGWVKGSDLVAYTIRLKETDLYIRTCTNLSSAAFTIVKKQREALEGYILANPFFGASFEPVQIDSNAPRIVRIMAEAADLAGVGPMAAVAGALSQMVGEELSGLSAEVIIENGGDNYLKSSKERIVAIYAGTSPLSGRIALRIQPEDMPAGICTSSGTVGPSISLGKTDATVLLAPSAALADAAATAIGNTVRDIKDIPRALKLAQGIKGVSGVLIITGDCIGAWGKIEICRLDDLSAALD
jgi:uncharacterized protein